MLDHKQTFSYIIVIFRFQFLHTYWWNSLQPRHLKYNIYNFVNHIIIAFISSDPYLIRVIIHVTYICIYFFFCNFHLLTHPVLSVW